MPIGDMFKVSRKTFFNPRKWLGYDTLKQSSIWIYNLSKDAFTPQKATREETFEQALQRLKLTEDDIKERTLDYRFFFRFFLFLSIVLVVYAFYLLLSDSIFGFLLTIAAAIVSVGQLFKYHFWLFQIKHRKLGCTLHEWFSGRIQQGPQP